jgi:hypothetical protein
VLHSLDPAATKITTIWDGGGIDTIDASAFTGAVTINLTPGARSTISGSGSDTIYGNAAGNYIAGGAGIDTAAGFSLRHEYDNISIDGGAVVVGGQTTVSVENIRFADGRFTTDVHDTAAQVCRLYGATLDRAPDAGSLRTWTTAIEKGHLSLNAAVDGFTASAESQQKYGSLDNTRFTTLLYNNVFDRAPNAGGLANWVDALNKGMTRSQAVLGFSESAEEHRQDLGRRPAGPVDRRQ